MSPVLQRLTLLVSLLAIFAAGTISGWFGHRSAVQGQGPAPPTAPGPVQAGPWTDRALATLAEELQLSPEQVEAIRPVLSGAAGRMDLDSERALFQIHMQVLKVHDEMIPHLKPEQLPALKRMRERLQQDIKRRFAAFLQDPSQPGSGL